LAPHIDHIDTHSSDKNNCFETYLSLFKLFLQIIQKGCSKRKITYKISEWFIMLANSTNSQWPNNRERVGTSKIRTSKVQKKHRKSKKIEKDQDVKSQIRLSMFWSNWKSNFKVKLLKFWFYLWRQKRSERWKSNFQILTK
jgi:hypothetical protein